MVVAFPEWRKVVRECHRVLRIGGKMFLVEPSATSIVHWDHPKGALFGRCGVDARPNDCLGPHSISGRSNQAKPVRPGLDSRQRLRTAASGAEALAMVEQEKPELLLSDISMPEMSGYLGEGTARESHVRADPRAARATQEEGGRSEEGGQVKLFLFAAAVACWLVELVADQLATLACRGWQRVNRMSTRNALRG
jgi:CheY-like chemotaxis protein